MPRLSLWDDTLVNLSVASGGQEVAILTLTPGAQSEGFTMVRCLVHLAITPASPLNDGSQMVDLGIGLASKEAVALEALPDSNTTTDQPIHDWVWRQRCLVLRDNADQVEPIMCIGDFRGGRKLGGGQLFLIANNTPLFGTAFTTHIVGLVRCLLLRP